ncbi:MAG: GNAT family N-acetyltransferase [Desulfobacterales bacterium]|nr:GNAT family N-acetyltransferase [Desulfobacterales bacterium]
MSTSFSIRKMQPEDRQAVAGLICLSTSVWYEVHFGTRRFTGGPQTTELYYDVYHALPGSSGIVAVDSYSGIVAGSCFLHVRPTHVSLGIMNVHPSYAGRGIASALLKNIIDTAEQLNKPLHLVSSAMNLDSFSLYNRKGFIPFCIYQDMKFQVPDGAYQKQLPASPRVRKATLTDLPGIVELERDLTGLERPDDYRHFIENPEGIWSVTVCDSVDGNALDGVLCSVCHPATNMIGPGCTRNAGAAEALLLAQLNQNPGRTPVALVPCSSLELRNFAYSLDAQNTEIHVAQSRGTAPVLKGLTFPTFLPETF